MGSFKSVRIFPSLFEIRKFFQNTKIYSDNPWVKLINTYVAVTVISAMGKGFLKINFINYYIYNKLYKFKNFNFQKMILIRILFCL